ncbi:MAG: DUF4358 domain-containing protein [Clostridia bacterium]|nr:DUF4358 domain-containing protein [Clostridia bacterium]
MKKILRSTLALALIGVFAVLFTACSSGGKTPAVSDIVTAITEKYPMSDAMIKIDDETTITNTIGIEKADYTDIAVYVNNSGLDQDEIIIVKATDADAAKRITEVLNNQLTGKMNSTKNYLPEQYEIVEKCKVVQEGDYLSLIISPDADAMNEIFKAQLK